MQTWLEIPGKRTRLPFDVAWSKKVDHLSYLWHLGKVFQPGASGPWVSNNGPCTLGHVMNGQTPPSHCATHFPWGARRRTVVLSQLWPGVPGLGGRDWVLDPALLQPYRSNYLLWAAAEKHIYKTRENTMTPKILACLKGVISRISHPRKATHCQAPRAGRKRPLQNTFVLPAADLSLSCYSSDPIDRKSSSLVLGNMPAVGRRLTPTAQLSQQPPASCQAWVYFNSYRRYCQPIAFRRSRGPNSPASISRRTSSFYPQVTQLSFRALEHAH